MSFTQLSWKFFWDVCNSLIVIYIFSLPWSSSIISSVYVDTNIHLYWPDLILMNSDQSQAEEAEWVGLTITEALHKAWRNRRNLPQNRPKPLKEVYEERLVLKLHCKWQFTSGGCTIFFIVWYTVLSNFHFYILRNIKKG